jgi:hypothetical protein
MVVQVVQVQQLYRSKWFNSSISGTGLTTITSAGGGGGGGSATNAGKFLVVLAEEVVQLHWWFRKHSKHIS